MFLNTERFFVNNKVVAQRYDKCRVCNEYDKVKKICKVCKCFMPAKRKIAKATCPLGKW